MRLMAESTSAEISDLKSWKQQTSVVMEELINELETMKSEISDLNCQCRERQEKIINLEKALRERQEKIINLEKKLQESEEAFNKKLIVERVSRQDENHHLRTALSAKEIEINQLNADAKEATTDARKLQDTIDSMSLITEPILAENLDLKKWKQQAITNSVSEKDKLKKQIHELTLWKDDALLKIERRDKEKLASDALAQMVVDLENKLERYRTKFQDSTKALAVMEETLMTVETQQENELERYRTKYEESTKALAVMEEALMTVETHRKMLVQTKPCTNGEINKKPT